MALDRSANDPPAEQGNGDAIEHPIAKFRRYFAALVVMPAFVGIAWWKAPSFNPYTTSFFTKTHITPTPGFPGEMRIAGWVFVALGALLLFAFVRGLVRKRVNVGESWPGMLTAVLVVAFGGAFFVAADSAQSHIEQRTKVE